MSDFLEDRAKKLYSTRDQLETARDKLVALLGDPTSLAVVDSTTENGSHVSNSQRLTEINEQLDRVNKEINELPFEVSSRVALGTDAVGRNIDGL